MAWLLFAGAAVLLLALIVVVQRRRRSKEVLDEATPFMGTRVFGGKPPLLEYRPRDPE